MDNNDFPNVIFLELSKLDRKDNVLDCYYELLLECRDKTEIMIALSMFYDEVVERTGKLIIERQIINMAKQLIELRANSEFSD